ncbi:protein of unknown function [Shinella sp. WSC3-e]|nr:protein of unknown function [Shinella sp. WSC3-e]
MQLRKFTIGDCVTVDDSLLKLAAEFDETIPDPSEIVGILIRKFDARSNTGMHEAEVGGLHFVDRRL